jgi:antimicrobial peptide system SdpB family protein
MIKQLYYHSLKINPWGLSFALARSLLALSSFLVLLNSRDVLTPPLLGQFQVLDCSKWYAKIGIFCFTSSFEINRSLALLILSLVVGGVYPRFTGLLHWWVSYSVQNTIINIDGGAQINLVLTTLLLPLCLLDSRRNHWKHDAPNINTGHFFAVSVVAAIRLQMAIIYFHAFSAKLAVPEWLDGTAIYYWIRNPTIGVSPIVAPLLEPLTSSSFVGIITWGTLIVEILLFGALFSPKYLWKYFFWLAVSFHVAIALTFGLVSFGLSMVAGLVIYFRSFEGISTKQIDRNVTVQEPQTEERECYTHTSREVGT